MTRLLAFLFSFFLAVPALAQAQLKPALAALQPHPSLWHVKGEAGEIYLLGSVHVLPSGVNWRTPEISRALARSDVFVFEVPEDEVSLAQLNALIQAKGFLPPGESLRARLHAASLADYDAAGRRWVVPAETVRIEVARSAAEPVLAATVALQPRTLAP